MVKSSDFCESFEKLKSECVEESLKKGEDATQLTKRVLKDFILFSSTKRRPLPQKDFNNGSKSECFTFTTENTPKKPRTQLSPKPDTNANGETPVILSKSETHGDFNNGSKSECLATENNPKKPRTQRLASPKPDTNTNGETPVILSKSETLVKGKMPMTKPVKKLRFIFGGKELKKYGQLKYIYHAFLQLGVNLLGE
uniref:Uncharacterized protein n=1 Tax=Quercus lobata TaxID=97700 RepID=A0A7N2RDB1_QUELO